MQLLLKIMLICSFSFSLYGTEKVVLITGGSRGIGQKTAEILAQKGYRVYATVRGEAFDAHGVHFKTLDVTDPSSIKQTVASIIEQEGRLDILINNAGYGLAGPVESLTMSEIQEQIDVNFYGAIRMCQEVLPHMRKQMRGHIINISSEQGVYGLPHGSLYTASKAALESLSEALSIEVMPWNIAVSIVEPGFVRTQFSVKLGSKMIKGNPYQQVLEEISKSLDDRSGIVAPSQTAEEVAIFICSVIEEEHPRLRYQTSKAAEEMVSIKLKDLTGEAYTKKMTTTEQ